MIQSDLDNFLGVPHGMFKSLRVAPLTFLAKQFKQDLALSGIALSQSIPEHHSALHGGPAVATSLKHKRNISKLHTANWAMDPTCASIYTAGCTGIPTSQLKRTLALSLKHFH